MEVILVRHGIAEDPGPRTGYRDAPRELTPEGVRRMRRAAAGMRAIGLAPDAVLTSPLARCLQTAELVAAALGGEVTADERLAPGARVDAVIDLVVEHPDARSVLVCGHQPDLSHIAADLVGGGRIPFRKGGAALVDLVEPQPGRGLLLAVLPPRVLRALGGP